MKKLLLILLIGFSFSLSGQTNISGFITANTTWTVANSPYTVTNNLLVFAGVTLTIDPGVEVKIAGGKSIQISGELNAIGTLNDSIIFEDVDSNTPFSFIEFTDSSEDVVFDSITGNYQDGNIMKYVKVIGGGSSLGSIVFSSSTGLIRNSTVSNSSSAGIYLQKNTTQVNNGGWFGSGGSSINKYVQLDSSSVTNNTGSGFLCSCYQYNIDLDIRYNDITYNNGSGINTSGGDSGGSHKFIVIGNNISFNGTPSSGSGGGYRGMSNGNQIVRENIISNNNGYGINTRGNGSYYLRQNLILNNSGRGIDGLYASHFIDSNVIFGNDGAIEISQGGTYNVINNQILKNKSFNVGSSPGSWNSYVYASGFDPVNPSGQKSWSSPVFLKMNSFAMNFADTSLIAIHNPDQGTPQFILDSNNIGANSQKYMIYNNRAFSSTIISPTGNFFNGSSSTNIGDSIWDWNDNSSIGIVSPNQISPIPVSYAPMLPPKNVTIYSGSPSYLVVEADKPADFATYRLYTSSSSICQFTDFTTDTLILPSSVNLADLKVTLRSNTASGCQDFYSGEESYYFSNFNNVVPITVSVSASDSLDFCQGDSVTLTASGGQTYLWNTGATTTSITVNQAGAYYVIGTSSSGLTDTSSIFNISILPGPDTSVTASGPLTFCNGDSVSLSLNSGNEYLWYSNPNIFSNLSFGQTGIDIDGEAQNDQFGSSVALSVNADILAIGAPRNDGNGNNSGHVRVFEKSNGSWIQIGSDIDGESSNDNSGTAVSLSADGTILAIGAPDNNGTNPAGYNIGSGHVRVYQYSNGNWSQMGNDIDGEAPFDDFGHSVSLSDDGLMLAVGAPHNSFNGTASDHGHTRVYSYSNSSWLQVGGDIDGEATANYSGYSVSLSSDGNIVAIGAPGNDDGGADAGHVRVYELDSAGSWVQLGIDIDGNAFTDELGISVSLSSNGNILAVGGHQNDGNGSNAGHVKVYQNINSNWQQIGSDIYGEATGDESGKNVSISADGTRLAIGAINNDGNGSNSGHIRIYEYLNSSWSKLGSDIDGESAGDYSGSGISISGDGTSVAIGAVYAKTPTLSTRGNVRVYSDFSLRRDSSITINQAGSYYAVVTTTNGCVDTTNTFTTSVISGLDTTIIVNGSLGFCNGDSVTLTGVSGQSYLWNTGDTSQSITVSQSGSYSAVISLNGCLDTTAVYTTTVFANADTSVTASGPLIFCNGNSVTLSAAVGQSYLWNNGDTNQSITINQAGSYYAEVTSSNGCVDTTNTFTTSVISGLDTTIIVNGSLGFCNGDSVTLTGVSGQSYLWNTGDTSQSITISQSGSYYAVLSSTNGCFDTTSTYVTSIFSNADTSLSVSQNILCNGDSAVLTAVAGQNYLWSNGSTSNEIIIYNTGNYYVTITTNDGCIGYSDTVNISGTITQISGPQNASPNSLKNYSTAQNPMSTYVWTVTGGNLTNGQGTNFITVLWKNFPSGTVILYESNGTCQSYDTLIVNLSGSSASLDDNSLNSIILSPNPNSGLFNIQVDQEHIGLSYQILDNLGRLIDKGMIRELSQDFDLSDKPKGIYRIQVSNDKALKTLNVVIQ